MGTEVEGVDTEGAEMGVAGVDTGLVVQVLDTKGG